MYPNSFLFVDNIGLSQLSLYKIKIIRKCYFLNLNLWETVLLDILNIKL